MRITGAPKRTDALEEAVKALTDRVAALESEPKVKPGDACSVCGHFSVRLWQSEEIEIAGHIESEKQYWKCQEGGCQHFETRIVPGFRLPT